MNRRENARVDVGGLSSENSLVTLLEICEISFYGIETFALPFAIVVFLIERRKQRQVDEEELY